jgi:antitoxin ParD1/3/4
LKTNHVCLKRQAARFARIGPLLFLPRHSFILDSITICFYALPMDSTMNISLPEPLKKWVERQVAKKGYGTADEFVVEMLRREQAQEAREQVDALLIAALGSGGSTPMTEKDWERIHVAGRRRFHARQTR